MDDGTQWMMEHNGTMVCVVGPVGTAPARTRRIAAVWRCWYKNIVYQHTTHIQLYGMLLANRAGTCDCGGLKRDKRSRPHARRLFVLFSRRYYGLEKKRKSASDYSPTKKKKKHADSRN